MNHSAISRQNKQAKQSPITVVAPASTPAPLAATAAASGPAPFGTSLWTPGATAALATAVLLISALPSPTIASGTAPRSPSRTGHAPGPACRPQFSPAASRPASRPPPRTAPAATTIAPLAAAIPRAFAVPFASFPAVTAAAASPAPTCLRRRPVVVPLRHGETRDARPVCRRRVLQRVRRRSLFAFCLFQSVSFRLLLP